MGKTDFVHLHVHTEYSLLDGLSQIHKNTALFDHVKGLGMDSVAITDHGAMYGVIEFYKEARKQGVKPIIGMEAYITDGRMEEKDNKKKKTYHQLLLAKNLKGYKNLMKLTSLAHLKGYYYRPRIDHETLKAHAEGLIATSTCAAGEVPKLIASEGLDAARAMVQWFLDVFGEDYYLELQRHEYERYQDQASDPDIRGELDEQAKYEKLVNEGIVKLSREMGIPLIATNDAHYIKKEDAPAQDALVCIATGKNISDKKRLRFIDAPSYYINSPEQMAELFPEFPEALTNTKKIADKCELEISMGKFYFPEFKLPKGKSAADYLKEIAFAGLKKKYDKVSGELKERLEYELKVINDKGYAPYFLVFEDMARWTIERQIPINIRGSVAGSLVSYCLGITIVDPIRYNLPFERFLNPYRPSAPDIDMDIADDMRDEMISYLRKKYGEEKVAQICTFGRMLARGSVRDVARVLGYPYETGDRISKMIPLGSQGFPMTINKALKESSDLVSAYNSDTDTRDIIDLAKEVEGNARHISVHAGGVVVSPTTLEEFTPVQHDKPNGEKVITQYEMISVEDVGLVKLDILGLRNLSILREAVQRVKGSRGKAVDLLEIPLNDKKTYEMLSRGETLGVFQLSGSGMTRYLVELQPERIEDIMIMIALFRPGPMDNIDEYIARKQGKKKITYYHPKMKAFLDKSLGVLVYQDDLLYTALEVAGYDWEEVDKFRKAVGKKIPEEMAKQHVKFVQGAIKHSGMTKLEAEGLWNLFEPFQGYGFNKAHSASYGMVAYQTAYMKANYPVEYMASYMTAESGDTTKVSAAVNESKRMGIKVLPPDVNESDVGFTVVENEGSLEGKAIRFGLSAIKNVGESAVQAILKARDEGRFTSLSDFLGRVESRKVNKRVLESLVKVGAMEGFGSRAGVLDTMDEIRSRVQPKSANGQQGLFGEDGGDGASVSQVVSDLPEFEDREIEEFEKTLLGLSLSAQPIEEQLGELASRATHRVDELGRAETSPEGVRVAGLVTDVRVVTTKKSQKEMAFVSLSDGSGSVDAVVFPQIYQETKNLWTAGNPLLIVGKIDQREEGLSVLVDKVDTLVTVGNAPDRYSIVIPDGTGEEKLIRLRALLQKHSGPGQVDLVFQKAGMSFLLPFGVAWDAGLAKEVSDLLQ